MILEVFQIVVPEFQGIVPVVSEKTMYTPDGTEVQIKVRFFQISGVEFRESEIPGVFNSEYVLPYEADGLEKKLLEDGVKFDRILM